MSGFDPFRLFRPREEAQSDPGEDSPRRHGDTESARREGERESGGVGESGQQSVVSGQHSASGDSPQRIPAEQVEGGGGAERRTPNAEPQSLHAPPSTLPGLEAALTELRAYSDRMERATAALEKARAEAEETLKRARDESARRGLADATWASAPLDLRLQFIRGVLDESHPLQPALKEAAGLLDLCRKGSEFEGWVTTYSTLFADSYMLLIQSHLSDGGSPPEQLAAVTLQNVREALDQALAVMGAEWIAPEAGAPVSEDMAVAGEENVPGTPAGCVTRCERWGLRRRGAVLLPARVRRQSPVVERGAGSGERPNAEGPTPNTVLPSASPERAATRGATEAAGTAQVSGIEPDQTYPPGPRTPDSTLHAPRSTLNDNWPHWLRSLHRSSAGQSAAPIAEALAALTRLAESRETGDAEVREWMEPLLPLLGPGEGGRQADLPADWLQAFRNVRPELLDWLSSHAGVEILAPTAGSPFDPGSMEAAGERRTAHQHEVDTVAKVERPGLRRQGRVLVPARVLRYAMGDGA